jgi:quercetin dioxygenase-like cupin family protein
MIRVLSRRGVIAAVTAGIAAMTLRKLAAQTSSTQPGSRNMDIDIKRNGSRPSAKGSPDWFTGSVRVDPLFQAPDPARAGAGQVTFEPGARTHWHTHPLGQTLIITSGLGWVQRESGPIEEVRPGDVVWFPPGLKHWHGASATTAMTHIAIQESVGGRNVEWMEKVTDDQYRK